MVEKLYVQLERPICRCEDNEFDIILDTKDDAIVVQCKDCKTSIKSDFNTFDVDVLYPSADKAPPFKN